MFAQGKHSINNCIIEISHCSHNCHNRPRRLNLHRLLILSEQPWSTDTCECLGCLFPHMFLSSVWKEESVPPGVSGTLFRWAPAVSMEWGVLDARPSYAAETGQNGTGQQNPNRMGPGCDADVTWRVISSSCKDWTILRNNISYKRLQNRSPLHLFKVLSKLISGP